MNGSKPPDGLEHFWIRGLGPERHCTNKEGETYKWFTHDYDTIIWFHMVLCIFGSIVEFRKTPVDIGGYRNKIVQYQPILR